MGEIRYYRYDECCFKTYYTEKKEFQVPERHVFFTGYSYEIREVRVPIDIPVLLYRDGENFYEFFSRQLCGCGEEAKYPYSRDMQMKILPSVPNIIGRNPIECDAGTFLAIVKGVLRCIAEHGITEEDIRKQIKEEFSQAKYFYEKKMLEQKREAAAKDHRIAQAQQELEEMLK